MSKESDKRPRIYQAVTNTEGGVEVTVRGAEGETVEDIEETAKERLADLIEKQAALEEEDYDGRETQ